jgi:putative addiction module component (TIGR02574 family)
MATRFLPFGEQFLATYPLVNRLLSYMRTACIFWLMPLTVEQIIEEARHWPPEKVGELVGRLTESLHTLDPETEAAWKNVVDRRIREIQSGKVQGVPGDEVSARVRKIVGR